MSGKADPSPVSLFEGVPREVLIDLYLNACETIVELERNLESRITNEPGTSWEIKNGRLHIRMAL